jgi:hypothetical protein
MCGLIDDAFSFVKDSVGEVFSHPAQALGAAFGVPGYDPFFGGLFNNREGGALISPTGNFTSSAWNDMYNQNPSDSGALGLFHGVNAIADKVAPAVAGYFAGPALGAAMGSSGGAAPIAADTFGAGLGDTAGGVSSLGGLESGMGGAALFGPAAGTGTAIGPSVAQGLGAGGLGMAGGDSLGGLTASSGMYTGGLGGSTGGTGLSSLPTGGAQVPGNPSGIGTGGGSQSLEGGQAAAMPQVGNPAAAAGATGSPGGATGGDLSALYGPTSTALGSPAGTGLGQSTAGVGGGVTPYGATLGQDLSQGAAGGGIDLQSLFNLAKSGYGAYQQWHQGQQAQNYMNGINNLFTPNSPYAQQMAQTLARQDAKEGRNSQYGTRATQLAAALTQAQAQAMSNPAYASAAQNAGKGNILNSLFSNFSSPGAMQNLYNTGSAAFNGLSSLFGG